MEPYSQRDHDEAIEDFGLALLVFGVVVIGLVTYLIFG